VTAPPARPDPGAYYAAGWQPPAPPRDVLAVNSLVAGLIALGPVALGLGIAALGRIRRGATRGTGFAVAGIALGTVWTLLGGIWSVAGVLTWQATRPLPQTVTSARPAYVGQLRAGSCVEHLAADGDVSRVTVVPCRDPHAAEVVTTYAFGATDVWPGQERVDDRVAHACQLTAAEESAGVRAVVWAPTLASWESGDRTGLCLATLGTQVTGSFLDGTVTAP